MGEYLRYGKRIKIIEGPRLEPKEGFDFRAGRRQVTGEVRGQFSVGKRPLHSRMLRMRGERDEREKIRGTGRKLAGDVHSLKGKARVVD